ncbi:hypothetical protein ACFQQB_32655 [Nonomuraea rubra]|uniref:hypothetical protein n=1 Tax=Nonomuraea rubra TaxID=46180 RepID=UPI00360A5BAD
MLTGSAGTRVTGSARRHRPPPVSDRLMRSRAGWESRVLASAGETGGATATIAMPCAASVAASPPRPPTRPCTAAPTRSRAWSATGSSASPISGVRPCSTANPGPLITSVRSPCVVRAAASAGITSLASPTSGPRTPLTTQ